MIGVGTSTVLQENSLPVLIKMKNGRALWSISPAFVNVSCKPWMCLCLIQKEREAQKESRTVLNPES